MSSEIERDFLIKETDPLIFYGVNDRNLKIIEKNFSVYLLGRGEKITITGPSDEVDQVVYKHRSTRGHRLGKESGDQTRITGNDDGSEKQAVQESAQNRSLGYRDLVLWNKPAQIDVKYQE